MSAIKLLRFGSEEYIGYIELRESLLRTPLGLNFSVEDLVKEVSPEHIHLGAFEGSLIVGTVMLHQENQETMKLRQLAVDQRWQHQGIGHKLVEFAEREAKTRGCTQMVLNSRLDVVSFYESLGYAAEGDEFLEVTIPHIRMSKKL